MDLQACKVSQPGASVMPLAASCAALAVVLAPAAGLIAWLCVGGSASASAAAAAIGFAVCWTAAALALCATYAGNRFDAPVQGVLGGMLVRLGLPLIAVVALPKLFEGAHSRGISTTILGVYLVALVVETLLALRLVPASPRVAKTGSGPAA